MTEEDNQNHNDDQGDRGNHLAESWQNLKYAIADLALDLRDWLLLSLGDFNEEEDEQEQKPEPAPEDSPEPEEAEPRINLRPLWSLLHLAVVAAFVFSIYYYVPPVRRVVNATAKAARAAIVLETNPPEETEEPAKEAARDEPPPASAMPEREPNQVRAAILEWLEIVRPDLDLAARLEQVDVLDHEVALEARRAICSAAKQKAPPDFKASIGATITAGSRRRPQLILAIESESVGLRGCTIAVRASGGYFECQVLADDFQSEELGDEAKVMLPWLEAVDLDGDGVKEILETWEVYYEQGILTRVYKLLPTRGWKRVWSRDYCYMGQVRVTRRDRHSVPRLVIANGVAPETGTRGSEVVLYAVSVYKWDRRLGTLRNVNEYPTDTEFNPEDVRGIRVFPPDVVPGPAGKVLDKHFTCGWVCVNRKRVEGYEILTIFDASRVMNASFSSVIVVDRDGLIRLAADGTCYTDNGVFKAIDLNGDGNLEAIIQADGGGAHGNMDYYVCALKPKFRLLAKIQAGRAEIDYVKDLDHNGSEEIILRDDCLESFEDLPCAAIPMLPMVLGCRGGRYVDVTRDFPRIVHDDIEGAKQSFREAVLSARAKPEDHPYGSARYHFATDWFACAAILGEQDKALEQIAKMGNDGAIPSWLASHKSEILRIVHGRSRKLSYIAPQL